MSRAGVDVIYDADCALCRRVLRLVQMFDITTALRFHASNDVDTVARLAPELSHADLDDAMYALDGQGRRSRGFFAFRRIVIATPLLWPLLALLYFPGSGRLGPRVYAWVAANRHRLGCRFDPNRAPAGPDTGIRRA